MKDKITEAATALFLKIGVRSVTMDDIATDLGISKKTIYAHFDTKTDLIKECIYHFVGQLTQQVESLCSAGLNPIEEMYEIKKTVISKLENNQFSPQFQLQKYYPEIGKKLQKSQFDNIYRCTVNNLEKGIAQGLYREEINVDFISRIYFTGIAGVREKWIFPKTIYSPSALSDAYLEYHLRSIVTEKGLRVLNNFIKTQ